MAYQRLQTNAEYMGEAGYVGVREAVFGADHPEVLAWTDRFTRTAYELLDFEAFHVATPRSMHKAIAVSTQWYRFSSFMPWFLCQAAAMVSTNEKRHYVIQTAFEELGMRDATEIHPEMFRASCEAVGVTPAWFESLAGYAPVTHLLDGLRTALLAAGSDEHVLGMLLGLELPAEDNISTVFWSAAHDAVAEGALRESKFFRLHMALEVEHVRLTVSNFLRFCREDGQKERFMAGFMAGTHFWRDYWSALAALSTQLGQARRGQP